MKKKEVTIEELEKILSEPNKRVRLKPNGEIEVSNKKNGKPKILTMKQAIPSSY